MSSGMNVEQAKELASKRNYKWAVGNLKGAYGISYKKATKILLYELAEMADRLVHCKDCRFRQSEDDDMVCGFEYGLRGSIRPNIDFCSFGERIDNE